MKRTITFLAGLMLAIAIPQSVFAYSFSAVAPSGQTLYYEIVDDDSTVFVTSQNSSLPYYSTYPTGSLEIPATVSDGNTTYTVVSIGSSAFYGCSGLTSVTIPNSVTLICGNAFYNCSGLTSVTIPNSVTAIHRNAFRGCNGLGTVTIPNSVTDIVDAAFSGVRHIEYHGSATGAPWGAYSMNGFTDGDFVYSSAMKDTLVAYIGAGGNVTISNSVIRIGNRAFNGCSGLTSVTIPASVTSMGNYAFSGCDGLTRTNYTGTIAQWCGIAFASGNSNPISFSHNLYINNVELTNLVIPEGMTSIGNYTFYNCTGLTSIAFPEGMTSIGYYTFYNCTGLTSITFPEGMTSIGGDAFYNCTGLTSVTFPSTLTEIGSSAFQNCSGLTGITCMASVAPQISNLNTFSGVSTSIPVHIPCGSQMSYYSRWSYFSNFNESIGFSFSVTSAESMAGSVVVLTQPTCTDSTAVFNAVPDTGYHFDHWSDGNTDNPRSLTITSDTSITAYFALAVIPTDTIYVHDTTIVHDTVYLTEYVHDTTYLTEYVHDTIYLTEYVHDTIYIHDTVFVGIDEVEAFNAKIYQRDGQIVVESDGTRSVRVFDVTGREVTCSSTYSSVSRQAAAGSPNLGEQPNYQNMVTVAVPAAGVYLVKIGELPARKVVVVR